MVLAFFLRVLVIFLFFSLHFFFSNGGRMGGIVLTFELMWCLSNSDGETPRAHCT